PLDQFVASVARADLLLTVDTAAAHLACALDAPAVVIHSGQHPGVYGPYSRSGRQIWLLGDRARLGRKFWQDSVPPEAVSAAIERALGA
ncbi:MAG: glycosyltransferase family 9 protein, partial [Chthoniobacterales bacterium]